MLTAQDLSGLTGKTMIDRNGGKIGKIKDLYDAGSGPDDHYVTVATGLFGTRASFVPLAQAELRGDDVVVPYDKDVVKHAPRVDDDEDLTAEEEDRLYEHYRLPGQPTDSGAASTAASAAPAVPATGGTAGSTALTAADATDDTVRTHDRGHTDDTDEDVLYEERLKVGVERRESGRARLVKRVTSELETATVPVSHDEVRITSEPITDAEATPSGTGLSEEVREVVLAEEVPVVEKEVVPVEEVHLDTETVHEQVEVTETLRKEHVADDGDPSGTDSPGRQ